MIDSQMIQTIGLVLLHFTWQGVLIGMLFAAGRLALAGASAVGRYNWAVLCLLFLAMAPLLTFAWISSDSSSTASGMAVVSETLQIGASDSRPEPSAWIPSSLLPLIVGLWLCGVVLMSARLGTGWWYVNQLRRNADFRIPRGIKSQLEQLALELDLARSVGLALSDRIAGPMLVGVFRPLILLPVGLANRLSTRELEMVLAHELAHLHRADHIVNLFQNIVETLLFYHPVVRWVSNVIRAERELASDDQAARLTGDRITYAETLLKLEKARGNHAQLAIGMADHQLITRVRYLLAPKPRQPGSIISGTALLTVALISLAAALASTGLKALSDNEPVGNPEPAPVIEVSDAPSSTDRSEDQAQLVPPEAGRPTAAPSSEASSEPSRVAADLAESAARPEPLAVDPSSERPEAKQAHTNDPPEPSQPAAIADSGTASSTATEEEPAPAPAPAPAAQPESKSEPTPEVREPPELAIAALTESATVEEPRLETRRVAAREPAPEPGVLGGSVLEQFAPEYPTGARRQGREGRAEVRLTVNGNGRVVDAVIVEESPRGYGFGEAAIQAVEQWRFEPFTRNGEPVRHEIQTGFDFTDPPACERVTGSRIARC